MIETERLLMRPFGADDAELLNQLYSNEEIMRYMPFDLEDMEASRARLERILRDWQADPVMNYEFAVIRKDTGEKIGRSHIQIDADTDTGMVGWLLLEKEWDKGYATEMTAALITYCFDVLGLHRVNALCHPDNIRSRRVLEKFMRQEAHYREKCRYVKQRIVSWRDELEYAVLKTEAPRP